MPELTDVSLVPTPTVTETLTVFPSPPVGEPAPPVIAEPPTAVLDPAVSDQMRSLLEGINGVNAQLEGTAVESGPLVLDAEQFGVLGLGLALVVALLVFLAVVSLRR